jgi:hypothetical protein
MDVSRQLDVSPPAGFCAKSAEAKHYMTKKTIPNIFMAAGLQKSLSLF